MPGDGFRQRANAVRSIPLADVLAKWGADRDRLDRNRWHTERGPVSITGSKFFNWHLQQGGGGAIDLTMHLGDCNASVAVGWLKRHLCDPGSDSSLFSPADLGRDRSSPISTCSFSGNANIKARSLCLPVAHPGNLSQVRRYLTEQRRLCPSIIRSLITSGKLYADRCGNAVFPMVAGKVQRSIGAELRGTGRRAWRGLAPGTRKDAGYFWIGESGNATSRSKSIVLCESAIDAISCYQLDQSRICLSTAGARSDARWLAPLLSASYDIHCGFDDDEAGDTASRQMIRRHPSIRRLRPPAHDWNDAIVAD
jgi:hypothetical protein